MHFQKHHLGILNLQPRKMKHRHLLYDGAGRLILSTSTIKLPAESRARKACANPLSRQHRPHVCCNFGNTSLHGRQLELPIIWQETLWISACEVSGAPIHRSSVDGFKSGKSHTALGAFVGSVMVSMAYRIRYHNHLVRFVPLREQQ